MNDSTANSQLVPGQSFGYGFDAMGNRTSTTAGTAPNVASSGYKPNALNQFLQITTPGKLDVLARSDSPATFQIDGQNIAATSVGNLHNAHANVANSPNGKHVSVSVTANGSTQSGARWVAPASVSPRYDTDGNLMQDGRWSYTWDGENRLTGMRTHSRAISAGAPNLTISFTYDFRSRKLRETLHDGSTLTQDERTLYDGWNPIAEFKGSAGVSPALSKTYLWGVDLSGTLQGAGGVGGLLAVRSATPVSGSSVFFPSYDTNGNIIAWSNESVQLIRRLDYDPFGNVVMKESFQGSTAELDQVLKHGFSTKPQNPESGLLYYGYRFYDPQLGRWLNRDPIEEEGGVNLYGFVGNDGVNRWDVLGLISGKDIVNGVIKVMGAKGWNTGQALMNYWWSRPGNNDPTLHYNDSIVKMSWALGYTQAKNIYDKLVKQLYKSANAKKLLETRLKKAGIWDSGGTFGYLYFDAVDWEEDGPNGEMYINSSAYQGKPPLNDLGAALGNFQMRIGLGGCLEINGADRIFHLREKHVYIVDSYNFNDVRTFNPKTWFNQPLGYWNFSANDVMDTFPFAGGFYYTYVTNGDFRRGRSQTGMGGDFVIYSDVKIEQAFEKIDLP